jgi:hypothetical protein
MSDGRNEPESGDETMTENTAKAPAGGIVSHVNGQFYAGGEFIPDTGRYCGKGKNRVAMAEFDALAARAAARGYTLDFSETFGTFRILAPTGNVLFSARNLGTIAKMSSFTGPR